jgi:hypothetical protein
VRNACARQQASPGAQFICFTVTRVLALPLVQKCKDTEFAMLVLAIKLLEMLTFTCFTSTKVQILTPEALLVQSKRAQEPLQQDTHDVC